MDERVVLITGAAGQMSRILMDREARDGWRYVLLDLIEPDYAQTRDDVRVVIGSVTDPVVVGEAMRGVTDVIHLGALGVEDEWERILDVNITGTRNVLEAARQAGVGRFVFASSNHAVGFYTPADAPEGGLPDDVHARPDTYYGWSKTAGEELVKLYCERFGLQGVALRIGHCFPEPLTGPRLSVWLSPADARALIDAALTNEIEPFQYVWGASTNTRSWLSPDGGKKIGFVSQDDSEQFVDRFEPGTVEVEADTPLGAHFTTVPLGVPMTVR